MSVVYAEKQCLEMDLQDLEQTQKYVDNWRKRIVGYSHLDVDQYLLLLNVSAQLVKIIHHIELGLDDIYHNELGYPRINFEW